MEPLNPKHCAELYKYASNPQEVEIAALYYAGNTEQRIAQLYAISRHRTRELLLAMQQRMLDNRLPFKPGDKVFWQGLGNYYLHGVVEQQMSIYERAYEEVRASVKDQDWYFVRTENGIVTKMGASLEKE